MISRWIFLPARWLPCWGRQVPAKRRCCALLLGWKHQSSGHVRFHGIDVSRLHARERKVGFVFQHYAQPHMTVFDNIAFGLTVLPRRDRPTAAA